MIAKDLDFCSVSGSLVSDGMNTMFLLAGWLFLRGNIFLKRVEDENKDC